MRPGHKWTAIAAYLEMLTKPVVKLDDVAAEQDVRRASVNNDNSLTVLSK
jgi:hypothetical protein